ncbi:hypothetical protein LTR10_017681 [Elasticomyces elasticus]|uniref:Transcription factor domain-containing protein n=1 Tax=Exophiala sideris TaxID=1016849 RepID=A0ABR0JBU9_9EURO|nr:hypothetical protein LTR10_017681 [Elasticomyces elasticus]KAK5031070.1 hypothetical protein LTS07_004805 [Exophiala sideris]KAK5038792.1 hypothetical protein LTR13_003823 [Exophiala sideris]KAK5060675.1 hypothetical protein LTR69_005274 [Exophiala sideris]KAK5183588.1 hypothetical protein LTR44_003870 [Eurotiomycetes sp. CCFEE 6388]
MKSQFMFINKNPESDSLSHSNKKERIQIHSHVQKGHRYKKSQNGMFIAAQLSHPQAGRRASSSASSSGHLAEEAATKPGQSTVKGSKPLLSLVGRIVQSDHNGQTQPQDANIDPRLWDMSQNTDLNIDPLLWDMSQHTKSNPSSPDSIPVFPASAEENFDPFDVTCVRVDQSIHNLLQYFLRVHHPAIWHLEGAVGKDQNYAFRYDALSVIQGCLHDQYNMYSLLASMSSYMTFIDAIPPSGNGNLYIHKALQSSKRYVESRQPITSRTVFNTFHLGCAEWYRYNVDAAVIHMKGAKAMVDSLGGLSALQGPLVELLVNGDAYIAAEMNRKPLWSHADFEAGEDHPMIGYALQELQRVLSGKLRTAAGLLTSNQQEIVPSSLRWVILDLTVVLSALKSSQTADARTEKLPRGGLHWIYLRNLAIKHRLLEMEFEDPRSEAVRIAVLLWIYMCFTYAGRRRSIKVIAPFLRHTLLKTSKDDWEGHEEVHLWILCIGGLSATLGSDEHTWFLTELKNSPIGTLDNSEVILDVLISLSNKFFYLESAQRSILKALAQGVSATRSTGVEWASKP